MNFVKTAVTFATGAILMSSCVGKHKKEEIKFTNGITVEMNNDSTKGIVHVTTEDMQNHKKGTMDYQIVPMKYSNTDSTVSQMEMYVRDKPEDSLKEEAFINQRNQTWIFKNYSPQNNWVDDKNNLTLVHKNGVEPAMEGNALRVVAKTLQANTGEIMSRPSRDNHNWEMVTVAVRKLENNN